MTVLYIDDLGRRLTRREVQDLLGISEDVLLSDPLRFGGVWFGPRKLVFFEKLISETIREMYASQKEQKERLCLDRPRQAPERETNREGISDKDGGSKMGIHPAVRAFAHENGPDLWPVVEKEN